MQLNVAWYRVRASHYHPKNTEYPPKGVENYKYTVVETRDYLQLKAKFRHVWIEFVQY